MQAKLATQTLIGFTIAEHVPHDVYPAQETKSQGFLK